MFLRIASAVPSYQEWLGCNKVTKLSRRSKSQGLPTPICSLSDSGKYCVKIPIWNIPEFVQFDKAKSIILNLPANGTAGLDLL